MSQPLVAADAVAGPGAHPPRAGAETPPQPAEVADLEPSIQYEEALAHAADVIVFEPGGRVTVPFAPRPGDAWSVDGTVPASLPAGRSTGRAIARSVQGSTWAPTPGPRRRAPGAGETAATSPGSSSRDAPVDMSTLPGPLPAAGPAVARAPSAGNERTSAATGLRRQVFGFLPYWELSDRSTTLNYALLSTIAYFSVGVEPDGDLAKRNADGSVTVSWSGWTSARLTDVIDAAHRKGTRVVLTLTLFGWTSGSLANQGEVLADPAARQRLARQAAAAVRDRGADGVNLDVEPLAGGHEDDFVALVRELRSALDSIAPGYQLTFDAMGRIGNYPVREAIAAGADAVFVMGYDYRTSGADQAGSIAPLSGPVYDISDTVRAYLAQVAPSKVILGVPYYGRAWSTVSSAINADNQSGPRFGASVSVPYANAIDLAEKYGRRWDPREQGPWFVYERENCTAAYGCVTSWRQVYYEDGQSLRLKYDLINRYGLRGAGIWALGYDDERTDLYQVIANKFLNDTTPPETGIKLLPSQEADEGFLVDWVARDDYNRVASFDVQVSIDGGEWQTWLTNSTAGADVWLGRDGHTYAFRARGRDAKGNLGTWDAVSVYVSAPALEAGGFARTTVDRLSVRAAPDPGAARVDTLAADTIVGITGGPVEAGGYTWLEVTEPVSEWAPVALTQSGVWVAAGRSGSSERYLVPVQAPNATKVVAGLSGLHFFGASSVGPSMASAARRAFSPNGDGSQDAIPLRWTARVALDTLALNVFRPDGALAGSQPVDARGVGPQAYDWDGRLGGRVVPDGTYLLQLVGTHDGVTYSLPSAKPVTGAQLARYAVTVDTSGPGGTTGLSARALSPNGDGRFDDVTATGTAAGAAKWSLVAAPIGDGGAVGAPVLTLGGRTGAGGTARVTWDGRADDGTVVPDGRYRLTLRVTDAAGNGPVGTWDVGLDTQAPTVTASSSPALFSPDGDGVADRAVLTWTSDERASGWLRILHGTTLVRRWPIAAGSTGRIGWDGRDASHRLVADGRYVVEAELTDRSGNRTISRSAVAVDRTTQGVGWSPTLFDPGDGDALADSARLTFTLSRPATTTLRIEDARGMPVRGAWHDRRQKAGIVRWTWDGTGLDRQPVAPGRYVAVLIVESPYGTTELRLPIAVAAFTIVPSATTLAAGDVLRLDIRSAEPLRSPPSVTFTQAGLAPTRAIARPVGSARYTVSFTVAGGAAGDATIVVAGRDVGGGTNRATRGVTVR
ncbi:MAG TPA: glycosyl hydrolase family 18 protein [Candidatus Limnocylindrales bacterium]